MALIEWRDEFKTGISGVDHEHQELIASINSFYAALDNNACKEKLVDRLNDIYGAIYSHFVLEEKLMEKYNYDQYEQHRGNHINLLDDIREITDNLENEQFFDEEHLKEILNSWFSVHFRTHDARLHQLQELIASGDTDTGTLKHFFQNIKDGISKRN